MVYPALHAVVETPEYLSRAESLLSEAERAAFADWIAAHPTAGDLIPGTGGARKVRWAAKGKGKRGGARVITYFAGQSMPVFLLSVFAKGQQADLAMAERNALRAMLADMANNYRKRGRRDVKGR